MEQKLKYSILLDIVVFLSGSSIICDSTTEYLNAAIYGNNSILNQETINFICFPAY